MNQQHSPREALLTAQLRRQFGDGPPDPEDIAQQAFQRLMERDGLDDIENLRAFLWRTSRNLLLNEKRSQKVRGRYDFEIESLYFPPGGDDLSPERVLLARQQLQSVNACLAAMSEKRRKALMLHRMEGLNVAAVARQLGVSRTAAAKHIARATADLDACLADAAGQDT